MSGTVVFERRAAFSGKQIGDATARPRGLPAAVMGLSWRLGALAAASAMAGDCFSSFVKRRFRLEPSSMVLGLDQVPESLFPAIACSAYLPLGPFDIALIVLVFSVGELAMSRLFFAVGLRDRPY